MIHGIRPFERAEDLNQSGESVDLAIVTTKSYDTHDVVRNMNFNKLMTSGGGILTLQNGMACAKPLLLQQVKKDIVVMDGVTDMGARILEPGVVQYTGLGLTIIEHADDIVAPRVADLFVKVYSLLTLYVPVLSLHELHTH